MPEWLNGPHSKCGMPETASEVRILPLPSLVVINMSKSKTILVTGCAGFIGSNFVEKFSAEGGSASGGKKEFPKTRIIGIDNFSTGRRDAVAKDMAFYEGSITDEKLLDKIFRKYKPEYVFHFAAVPRVAYSVEHPAKTTFDNIYGTVLLLEKSRDHKIKRFIYSSSSSVYGGAKILPTTENENPPNPISPYGLEKYVGEPFCKIASDLYGLDTVSLRYFNVFGPGQYGDSPYATVITSWLTGLYFSEKKKPFLEWDGRQSRDFCYVDNVVDANILAMKSKKLLKGEAFNIAHGERTDLLTVKNLIEKYTGKKLNLEKRPPRLGDVRHTHADISKAGKWLGYRPRIDFEAGLRRTIEWFKSRTR